MKRWLAILICLLAAGPIAVIAHPASAQSGEIMTPDQPLADAAQEARARRLMKEIRCVVCQSQSIDESEAGIAYDMRQIIRIQIQSGKSDGEIRDYLTDRYGDFVLLKPPFKAATLVLWLGPFALIGLAGLGIYVFYRRSSRIAAAALSPAERARLADFMARDGADEPGIGGQP